MNSDSMYFSSYWCSKALLLCLLILVDVKPSSSSLVEDYKERLEDKLDHLKHHDDDRVPILSQQQEDMGLRVLQERSTSINPGEIYSECSNNPLRGNRCNAGLDCVLTVVRKRFCFPMSCLRQAVEDTYLQYDGFLETFADRLLERVGLTAQSIFNRSALETMAGAGDDSDASQYVVNPGVTDKIHTAMQEDTTVLNTFQGKAQRCFPSSQDPDGGGEQSTTESYYMGMHVETAAIAKLVYQIGGASDTNGNIPSDGCYQHLCLGCGLDIDLHVSPVLGVISSGTPSEMRKASLMLDIDASALFHVGAAVGFTIPDFFFKAEWSASLQNTTFTGLIGGGLGGGLGLYACAPSFTDSAGASYSYSDSFD